MFIQNKQIVKKIGPETAMFYQRYTELSSQGFFQYKDHLQYGHHVPDIIPFIRQAKVVNQQIGTPVEIALAGLLYIHLGEQFRFDPLTMPWLN